MTDPVDRLDAVALLSPVVSDAALLESYARLGSSAKVSAETSIGRATVHRRLQRLGASHPVRVFTPQDDARLMSEYAAFKESGTLDALAQSMGRTKPFISRQAKRLGLTDPSSPKPWVGKWKYLPEAVARGLFEKFRESNLGLAQWCAKNGYSKSGMRLACHTRWPDEWEIAIENKVPAQTMYRLGRSFEYRTRDDLKKMGFLVFRSPRSLGPADLVAVATGVVLFVQCKRSGALPPKEWNALFDMALGVGAIPLMAQTPAGRGISYHQLTARKDGTKRAQPMEPFDPSRMNAERR